MTAPEVWTVTDPDGGWEVYIPNASGGWRVVSSRGGTAVVDTLPDGAERRVAKAADLWCRSEDCRHRYWRSGSMPTHRLGADCPEGGDRRG